MIILVYLKKKKKRLKKKSINVFKAIWTIYHIEHCTPEARRMWSESERDSARIRLFILIMRWTWIKCYTAVRIFMNTADWLVVYVVMFEGDIHTRSDGERLKIMKLLTYYWHEFVYACVRVFVCHLIFNFKNSIPTIYLSLLRFVSEWNALKLAILQLLRMSIYTCFISPFFVISIDYTAASWLPIFTFIIDTKLAIYCDYADVCVRFSNQK